jgi:antitoxin MazE
MGQPLRKWGNSLAVRIPKRYADELRWGEDTEVHAQVIDGKLVLEAVTSSPTYTLDELLDRVSPDNLHAEVPTGSAVGDEAW